MENDEFKDVSNSEVESKPAVTAKPARQWAMGCHLIGLCGVIVPVPAAGLIGTLILWLLKREDAPFIDEQGKEALNFQISLFIYAAVCFLLSFIGIGLLLLFPLAVFGFVCIIIAAIKASEGAGFRYPACLRFVK